MGLIQKKDEDRDLEFEGDVEVIGRGEGPDGESAFDVELHEGLTAEDISGTTAEREGKLELEADPELLADAADADEDVDLDTDLDAGANAADQANVAGEAPVRKAPGSRHKLYIAGAAVAVVAAAIIGYFIGTGGFGAKGVGAPTITEDQLDTAVASFSYNGATEDISAREAIESQYSLDAVKDPDGNFAAPTADMVLAYARNQILLVEAERQGISVDDDELGEVAMNMLGTDDFTAVAEQYRVTTDQAKEIVREQTLIQKLYGKVVKDATAMPPTAPVEPDAGNEGAASAEYASYIIELAGSEWDTQKGTWASEDGQFAAAFADDPFTADSATYEQANKAYSIAYQAYAENAQAANEQWTEYANGLFANAKIEVYGLFA